ncbi:tetratricopeptide repeat protein [Clostridium perfringens]|uniref:tetratricopeptide repeat protein n=1 Tax=Clostridium perfringens TaxID=1502 RepID=UPI000D70ECF2|nr:tetratricopeptide repeat protein [Clostridium perfringens]EIF2087108.1 tetratricopeptide repeat protein [Clostridium perfringens]ELC8341960.1 tetratricopeptide repeat protein [Clostridium perfringens]PWW98585.1 hypothetical protein CYK71_13920 [Clostridium perfringens]
MLSDIIVKYNKAKFEVVNKFSDNNINVCEESLCIDKGYLKSKFEDFQKEYKSICDKIENLYNYGENDDYNKSKINKYIEVKNRLLFETAYLISNDEKNLDLSKSLISGMNTTFNIALDGVESYLLGDLNKAKVLLGNYYSQLNKLPNHYLINKIYGTILLNEKEYDLALEILKRAVEIIPDDLDLHIKLRALYSIKSDIVGVKIEEDIIELLEVRHG